VGAIKIFSRSVRGIGGRAGALVTAGLALAVVPLAAPAAHATLSPIFQAYQAIPTGSSPAAVAIGDVTGDGRNDVVMTTDFYFDAAHDYRLWVFAQTSNGQLAPPVTYSLGQQQNPASVSVGDVTGDGRNDVVVGLDRFGIEVFSGQSNGTLSAPTLTQTVDSYKIRLGHLDASGKLAIAGIGWDENTVSVFHADSSGALGTPAVYSAPYSGYDDLKIADVTGDHRDDIVVMSGQLYATPNVSVLAQLPAGGFAPVASYRVGTNTNTYGIGLGDVNGDGRNDVVASYGGNRPDSHIAVFGQKNDGTLGAPTSYSSYDIPGSTEVADFDHDGRADVVTYHNGWNEVGVYRQQADGTLGTEELYPVPYASWVDPHGLAVGDINSDGAPDVVIADYNNGLVVLRNANPGTPPPPPGPADLRVSLSNATGGSTFAVKANVGNRGPNASDATLVVSLSGPAATIETANPACSVAGLTMTCHFSALAVNAATSVVVSGASSGHGTVKVTATVSGPGSDPNHRNNTAHHKIRVS
jgi:hypothetical protein